MGKLLVASAGDLSGDLYLSHILQFISKTHHPALQTIILGGGSYSLKWVARLRGTLEIEWIGDLTKLSAAGLLEALRNVPKGFGMLKKFTDTISKVISKQEAQEGKRQALLVDFPAFNLRLAERLKSLNFYVIYLIPPRSWMKSPKRKFLAKLRELIDLAVVPFPWLEKPYREAGLNVVYRGHPLLEILRVHYTLPSLRFTDIKELNQLLILPGSRLEEVRRTLPIFLKALDLLPRELKPKEVSISATENTLPLINEIIKSYPHHQMKLVQELPPWRAILRADLCWITSGTASLEVFLLGKRGVIGYKLNTLSALYVRLKEKEIPKYVSLPNLIIDQEVFPEVIQEKFTPEKVLEGTERALSIPSSTLNAYRDQAVELLLPNETGPLKYISEVISAR